MSKFKTNDEYFAYSKTLSVVTTEDIIQLLTNFEIKMPYYAYRFILRETIYSKVFQTKLYDTYSDELKYRLRGYNDYSIYLLEKLISDFKIEFDTAKFKEIFFNFLFINKDIYNLKSNFFDDLEKLKYKYTVDFEKIQYQDFIKKFDKILYESSGYLDGVSLKILKDVLVHSCTLGDLKGLGEKYNVVVPRRINKGRLVEILVSRFRLSKDEADLLNEKSVLELEIYAKEKGFSISIDLKKSDMVEFIIYDLKMYHQEIVTDNHSYDIPLATDVDSVKVDTIEFITNDQDIPVTEVIDENNVEMVVPPVSTKELLKSTPQEIETPLPLPIVEKNKVALEEKKDEVKQDSKSEPKTEKKLDGQKSDDIDFSLEEKELLDEKINQIIKKYHKRRRAKRFWTFVIVLLIIAIIGFVGYSYLYYTIYNPNSLPFGIPVFW
ncbi:MAG: hypothetical protein PHC62_03455 [Candidatus Izemoplasmatales bacterium]|jgi:hypothetical protein|nr:hypothetical protein [Candidatus Izemoplasmatales bacterium]